MMDETNNLNIASTIETNLIHDSESINTLDYTQGTLEDHVRILATLVPDEIIYKDENTDIMSNFNGVLLFVDVSGFTDLCEKYNSLGKGGPSRLTQVLNAYIGAMVQEIMSHNGDICKFSGDAFLALWKSTTDVSLSDVVHAALDCALGIQRSHGTYKTEINVTLRVKIVLGVGPITVSVIGDSNYMILGVAMLEVKHLSNKCEPGDIIITNNMKSIILPNEYVLENFSDNYARILSIGSEWAPSTISNQFELFDTFISAEERKPSIIEDDSELVIMSDDDDKRVYSYMLRPSLDYAASKNLNQYLRKFIIPPVVKAIDLCEPLEFLTEMRQVVIVFINIVIKETHDMAFTTNVCNITYNIVCDLVISDGGCVNKLSMFDKDLMYLVIFGLRGFKHNLEAQKALYCARRTLVKLQSLPVIESAAIGVCTGISYCGVVGHPMRKEYTVIGRTVNKAARLMVAYPDMVSCDTQTFVQSQLQAQYFKLLPTRYLKGFKNIGPIYKFLGQTNEQEVITTELTKTNKHPLLDRNREMECVFYHLFTKQYNSDFSLLAKNITYSDEEHDYNMIIVEGQVRQGKTRFLYEIAYYISESLVLVPCTFTEDDRNNNYKIFRVMFNFNMSLNETDVTKRTAAVKNYLLPFEISNYLCALNDVLNVNFPETTFYENLTDDEKRYIKHKMIEYLCVKAYQEKCVLTIDNIEYMDDESWNLMNSVLDTGLIFVCATVGHTQNLLPEAKEVLQRSDVKVLKLRPLHQLCQAALICQILNVREVSLDLERYIQIHSYGNPGWIESFLTTLLHSNALVIRTLDRNEAYMLGFVKPSMDMLFRTPESTITFSSCTLIEDKDGSFIENYNADIEDWDIYRQTIQDIEVNNNTETHIQICHISNKIPLEEIDTEDVLDVNMIQTYDSLKVQEQLLLKCSSILGNAFSRFMLDYVMQSQSYRRNAQAIQKLFEIRVFSCGRGIYTNGALQVDHYLTDPNINEEIACYCTGFPIHYSGTDLPKYANCGYIQFREPTFRQMLVNLLTDSQANLYHVRCIWFLESHTRRCLTCGVGYFTKLIGQSNDDGMKKYSMDCMPSFVRNRDFSFRSEVSTPKEIKITDVLSASFDKITNIGLANELHVRTFIDNNLSECECEAILLTMYKDMIEHCSEAGMHEKLMSVLLEYAALCIRTKNLTVGYSLLNDATELLEKNLKYEYLEPNWQVPLAKGQILHLKGQLHFERNSLEESEEYLIDALKCYNLYFPKNKIVTTIKTLLNEYRHIIFLDYFPHRYIGSKNEDICILADRTAEVLSTLFALYTRKLDFEKAYLASIWGMSEALRSDSNFAVLCNAYADILTIEKVYGRSVMIDRLESMAINMCYRKHTRLEKYELEAVTRLYGAIFIRKCLSFNMMESLKLGSIITQLNLPEFGGQIQWLTIPIMHKALMFTDFTSQAAILTQKMSYYKDTCIDHFGPMLFYTLCLEFRQYTTYSIEDFSKIKSFCIIQIQNYTRKLFSIIEMKYHAGLWLWFVRRKDWETAGFLISHIHSICAWPFDYDASVVYIFLHVLEGLLLTLVNDIDSCDRCKFSVLTLEIRNISRKLNKITNKYMCLRSRYLMLRAYWLMIYKKQRKAFKTLDKASVYAKKYGIPYDVDWIQHTRDLWLEPKHKSKGRDPWLVATDTENFNLDWKNMQNTSIYIPFFSFNLPL